MLVMGVRSVNACVNIVVCSDLAYNRPFIKLSLTIKMTWFVFYIEIMATNQFNEKPKHVCVADLEKKCEETENVKGQTNVDIQFS